MSEWKPIETAPLDGTPVVVCGPYDEPHIAAYRKRRYGHLGWVAMGCNGPAIESQDDFGTEYQEPGPLSYWMPRPEAPPT